MKIAIILDEEWDSALTHYACGVYKALVKHHDVKILCLKNSYIDKEYKENKIYIYRLRNKNPIKIIAGFKSLVYAFALFKPDVVVTILGDATFFSCLLKKQFNFKLVRIFGENKHLRTPRECIDKLLLPAGFLQEKVESKRVGSIDVVKGFVCRDKFEFRKEGREKIRKFYGISESEILFGSVGRLDKVKGYTLLIQAFSDVDKGTKLMIVGEEKNEKIDTLSEIIRENNLENRVLIINERRQDIVDIMSAFDVGVVSSIGSETIARVIFEFMSIGLPIVTSDAGMLKEVAKEEFAILVNKCSASSLSRAMKEILKKDKKILGLNATFAAQQYSFVVFKNKILSCFEAM